MLESVDSRSFRIRYTDRDVSFIDSFSDFSLRIYQEILETKLSRMKENHD